MANILLLEHHPVAGPSLIARVVGQNGWPVFAASSVDEALTLMRSGPMDLIVADLEAVCERSAELIERSSPVPVIVTSDRDHLEGVIDALDAGAANYIPAHLIPDRLTGAIQSALASARETSERTRLLGWMNYSHSRFSIPTDLSMLSVAADRMQASLEMFGLCDAHQTVHVRIALDEALANAYYHGNLGVPSDLKDAEHGAFEQLARRRLQELPYRDRRIEIEEHLTRDGARFIIRDEGDGFDIHSIPDPTDFDRLTRCGGRGILMMRHFLDEVIYNDVGNEVTLVKRCEAATSSYGDRSNTRQTNCTVSRSAASVNCT